MYSINLALHRYGKLTCHMGSHSVTCHPTVVSIPPLSPAEAGTRFSDPGGMQGWVDLCYVKATGRELNPRPVNRKSNALPLSHHATLLCMHFLSVAVWPNQNSTAIHIRTVYITIHNFVVGGVREFKFGRPWMTNHSWKGRGHVMWTI